MTFKRDTLCRPKARILGDVSTDMYSSPTRVPIAPRRFLIHCGKEQAVLCNQRTVDVAHHVPTIPTESSCTGSPIASNSGLILSYFTRRQ